jgi:uncharacterized hydrophobic protein (TIGR00271 family)
VLHLRLVVPPDRLDEALAVLDAEPGVCNQIVLPAAARRPVADVVLADVSAEAGNALLAELRRLDLHRVGSISIERLDTALSERHERAEAAASGDPSEAVIWEEVEWRLRRDRGWSVSYGVLLVSAALVAAAGILTDTVVLIVGAMVIGPEYGPLTGMAWGLHRRRREWITKGFVAIVVGFAIAIASVAVMTLCLRGFGWVPDAYLAGRRPLTKFISEPNGWSVFVAVVAAIAGTVSLTELKSGALVGVLISVTTVPAAAALGVAAAFGDGGELVGSAVQLVVNLVCIVLVGAATLSLQRRLLDRSTRLET